LLAFPNSQHPGEYADHATNRPSEHATHRARCLVAGLRALLDALDEALRISGAGCVENEDGKRPKHGAQPRVPTRRHWPAGHYSISMVDLNLLPAGLPEPPASGQPKTLSFT
jgi:hypothetical protein